MLFRSLRPSLAAISQRGSASPLLLWARNARGRCLQGSHRGEQDFDARDVCNADEIEQTWADAVRDLGRIDILVNNAGTTGTNKFDDVSDAMWREDFDLKIFSVIRLARLALPHGLPGAPGGDAAGPALQRPLNPLPALRHFPAVPDEISGPTPRHRSSISPSAEEPRQADERDHPH